MILCRAYLLTIRNQFKRLYSNDIIDINEEVKSALTRKKPVVALESTIITHGMRYPHNLETALEVENIIRNEGATPATIAVVNGKIKVGLDMKDIEMLARNQDETFKISRRDIPFMISEKCSGGTTVSGTMVIANKVGIHVFATGGIGGVHRNGEKTMDVSADLTELGRTPVAVVSAGIKSVLDIGRTLEYLETEGVAIATYGSTKDFPAFYTRKSGFIVPYCLKTPKEAAEFVNALLNLELCSGALIAAPIPEEHSFNGKDIEKAINDGIEESRRKNVQGKDVTPFLLEHISRMTAGESLKSNIALVKNNARIGSKISVELSKLRKSVPCAGFIKNKWCELSVKCEIVEKAAKDLDHFEIVVIGGSNLDNVINVDSEMKPRAVFFTCIDSRMIPTRFTETDVGDMFVVRNAGNLIPHSRNYPDEITTTEPAALELGCVVNNVRHIIVCGHSDCKAMNLLYALRDEKYSSQENRRISPLKAWMCAHASSSLEKFKTLLQEGFHKPLLFEAETPQRQFVAYIDPDNKFAIEDKLSQADGRMLPGKAAQSGGGVARNMADALGKLEQNPFLISAIGNDNFGERILETIPHLDHGGFIRCDKSSSATCYVICDLTGECRYLIGDMAIHNEITPQKIEKHREIILDSSLVVIDGNLSRESTRYIMNLCKRNGIPVWFEPTDIVEATKAFTSGCENFPEFISPNFYELQEILKVLNPSLTFDFSPDDAEFIDMCIDRGKELVKFVQNVIITLGKRGVLICRPGGRNKPFFYAGTTKKARYQRNRNPVTCTLYTPEEILDKEIVNASGAGDCFASGFIAAMLRQEDEESCVRFGFKCSASSLRCQTTIPRSFQL